MWITNYFPRNELVSIPQAVPRISTDSSFEGASRLPFPPMVREPIVGDHELIASGSSESNQRFDAAREPSRSNAAKAEAKGSEILMMTMTMTGVGTMTMAGRRVLKAVMAAKERSRYQGHNASAKSSKTTPRIENKYTLPCPPEPPSVEGVLNWLDHVEDLGSFAKAITPISPLESENIKQEEKSWTKRWWNTKMASLRLVRKRLQLPLHYRIQEVGRK
ncbi:uncharacterized protein BDCG_04455 [Blastomyces dermatitidis ER-3]|uniref:Uncharacterized protein n=2 Tax=Ajellomyces dermatitidis TaxID=5039 RepID=F2TFZ4_AJEDA|nr:uncharacterized protein BDCG_04455 [Blastomyces dermatitidis ER-3]EEQ89335.2 hypothetical protein BDCG_04455 [Blastomyces dermatitidis ER-3]EGE82157.2 hypothetical protein BDDG_05100 [Blastomyces dermatitidis ATCC 18188]EQL33500.1 hypothetical protein BDFG_04633 [Blastomyces dermatitidis ATCC 26199]